MELRPNDRGLLQGEGLSVPLLSEQPPSHTTTHHKILRQPSTMRRVLATVAEETDALHGPALAIREIQERWPVRVLVSNKLLELATSFIISPASITQMIKKHRPKQTRPKHPLKTCALMNGEEKTGERADRIIKHRFRSATGGERVKQINNN